MVGYLNTWVVWLVRGLMASFEGCRMLPGGACAMLLAWLEECRISVILEVQDPPPAVSIVTRYSLEAGPAILAVTLGGAQIQFAEDSRCLLCLDLMSSALQGLHLVPGDLYLHTCMGVGCLCSGCTVGP